MGNTLSLAAYGVVILALDPWVLLLAFVVFGAGESFVSGADSAFLFEAVTSEGRLDEYEAIRGNVAVVYTGSILIGSALCGLLVDLYGLVMPFVGSFIAMGLAVAASISFTQPKMETRTHWQWADGLREYAAPGLVGVALLFVFVQRAMILADRPFAQPVLASYGNSAATQIKPMK